MTSTIKGGDKLQEFLNKLKKQKARVDVGFFPDSVYEDGTQVAQVAIDNEFGHINENGSIVPARPFLLPTYNENKSKWMKILGNVIKNQGENINVSKALDTIGRIAQEDVREKIDWWAEAGEPRNAQSTQEKKGFDSPLIETGHMRESVAYKVTTK